MTEMLIASRKSVVNSSTVGKDENSSASCVYIETTTISSAPAMLSVTSRSSSCVGSGSSIIAITSTTTIAVAEVAVAEELAERARLACQVDARRIHQVHAYLPRAVRAPDVGEHLGDQREDLHRDLLPDLDVGVQLRARAAGSRRSRRRARGASSRMRRASRSAPLATHARRVLAAPCTRARRRSASGS